MHWTLENSWWDQQWYTEGFASWIIWLEIESHKMHATLVKSELGLRGAEWMVTNHTAFEWLISRLIENRPDFIPKDIPTDKIRDWLLKHGYTMTWIIITPSNDEKDRKYFGMDKEELQLFNNWVVALNEISIWEEGLVELRRRWGQIEQLVTDYDNEIERQRRVASLKWRKRWEVIGRLIGKVRGLCSSFYK